MEEPINVAKDPIETKDSNEAKKTKTTDELISENTRFFRFYNDAPAIFTAILGLYFFVLAIVDANVLEFIGAFWFLIGIVVCIPTFYLLKFSYSYKILQICYLKKIEENTSGNHSEEHKEKE